MSVTLSVTASPDQSQRIGFRCKAKAADWKKVHDGSISSPFSFLSTLILIWGCPTLLGTCTPQAQKQTRHNIGMQESMHGFLVYYHTTQHSTRKVLDLRRTISYPHLPSDTQGPDSVIHSPVPFPHSWSKTHIRWDVENNKHINATYEKGKRPPSQSSHCE